MTVGPGAGSISAETQTDGKGRLADGTVEDGRGDPHAVSKEAAMIELRTTLPFIRSSVAIAGWAGKGHSDPDGSCLARNPAGYCPMHATGVACPVGLTGVTLPG